MNDEQIKALWLRVTGFDADGDAADIIGFARALLADGGKGEAGEAYAKGYRAGKAFAQRHAPQAECAPREAQPVIPEEVRQALTHAAGGWRGAACDTRDDAEGERRSADYNRRAQIIEDWIAAPTPERADAAPKLSAKQDFESVWEKARAMDETTKTMARFIWDSAQSAEREAQPIYQVRPRNGEEWTDVSEAEYKISGGAGYLQRIVYAAPIAARADLRVTQSDSQNSERADADTAGAKPWWHALAKAADAVSKSTDVWHGFSIQDAKVCVDAYLAASASNERADAEKEKK
ncbi:MAG: hypothetical protein WCD76_17685 [Pyrinomonadaceae bacterium]